MGRRSVRGRGKGKKKRGGGSSKKAPDEAVATSAPPVCEVDASEPLAFAIGTRILVPDLLEHRPEYKYDTGTIVKHYFRDDGWEEGVVAPYAARMDCGRLFCNREIIFEKLDEEPLEILFKIGSRVECKLGESDEWFSGVVLHVNEKFVERDTCPYVIRFDYGRDRQFWGPPNSIRDSDIPPPKNSMKKDLRFCVGDRVECSCNGGNLPGTIIKTWYGGESLFEDGHTVPYQVQLDRGDIIFAPMDIDICIRRTKVAAPECWICFDNDQSESNLIVRECACRGEGGGFVHVNCAVKLAISKVDLSNEPGLGSDDFVAMSGCITCRQTFPAGSHCLKALCKTFYCATAHLDISNTWNKMFTTMMGENLVEEGDYDGAIKLLQDRISTIRSRVETEIEMLDGWGDDVADPHLLVNQRWLVDLSNFLLDLADVYAAMESYDEMKSVIEESLHWTKLVDGEEPSSREVNAIMALAKLCYSTGEKGSALEYSEKAISLIKNCDDTDQDRLLNLLWQAGELNIYFGKRKRGMRQLNNYLDIATKLYGNNHESAQSARVEIQRLREFRTTPYEAIMSAGK